MKGKFDSVAKLPRDQFMTKNRAVTFQFTSQHLEQRFGRIRAREDRQTQLCGFFRAEVFEPAARLAYRAMQPEYLNELEADHRKNPYWNKVRRMCLSAAYSVFADNDDGTVTVQMSIPCLGVLTDHALRPFVHGIDLHLTHEVRLFENDKDPNKSDDRYAAWRHLAYKDLYAFWLNVRCVEIDGKIRIESDKF